MKHIKLYEDFTYDPQQIEMFPELKPTLTTFMKMFLNQYKRHKPELAFNMRPVNKVSDLVNWFKIPSRFWYGVLNQLQELDGVYLDTTTAQAEELKQEAMAFFKNLDLEAALETMDKFDRHGIHQGSIDRFIQSLDVHPVGAWYVPNNRDVVIMFLKSFPFDKALRVASNLINMDYYTKLITTLEHGASKDNRYIDIYRAIKIPNDEGELRSMMRLYDGVGIYWSYEPSGAVPYNATKHYSSKESMVLHARIDVRNVSADDTLHKAFWYLAHEREIHILDGATVELMDISVNNNKMEFDEPLHVSVSSKDSHSGL